MKKAILTSLILVGFSAQASWFQENCSNADGTTKILSGHNENGLFYTERVWGNVGAVDTVIAGDYATLKVEYAKELTLERESSNSCKPGDAAGVGSWRDVIYRRVKITKVDGSPFSKDTLGVSSDLKSIEESMLCEENGNSEVMCK